MLAERLAALKSVVRSMSLAILALACRRTWGSWVKCVKCLTTASSTATAPWAAISALCLRRASGGPCWNHALASDSGRRRPASFANNAGDRRPRDARGSCAAKCAGSTQDNRAGFPFLPPGAGPWPLRYVSFLRLGELSDYVWLESPDQHEPTPQQHLLPICYLSARRQTKRTHSYLPQVLSFNEDARDRT